MDNKEKLEEAKKLYASANADQKYVLESLFPELKETVEDKIKKNLIEFLDSVWHLGKDANFDKWGKADCSDWIDWIKKQESVGEIVSRCKTSWYNEGKIQGQIEGLSDEEMYQQGWRDALEKQGDTSVFYVPEISIKDAVEVTSRMQYIEDDMKPIADFIIDYAYWDLHKDEWNQPTITVPLFRVLDALIQRGKPYCESVQNVEKQGEKKSKDRYTFNSIPRLLDMIEPTDRAKSYCQKLIDSLLQEGYTTDAKIVSNCLKQMNGEKVAMATMDEQKPAEKVEPKFQNGQWIVWQNKCYKVNYNGCGYELIDQNGLRTSLEYGTVDKSAHLWTIADAKDGDVLAEDTCIFIIEKMNPNGTAIVHCCLFDDGEFDSTGSTLGFAIDSTKPATKEQHDILFNKMKEAGYEWNAEKKELKKINSYCKENCKGFQETGKCFADGDCKDKREAEQKSAWSEEDEINLRRLMLYLSCREK
jgi:hypothetical protein